MQALWHSHWNFVYISQFPDTASKLAMVYKKRLLSGRVTWGLGGQLLCPSCRWATGLLCMLSSAAQAEAAAALRQSVLGAERGNLRPGLNRTITLTAPAWTNVDQSSLQGRAQQQWLWDMCSLPGTWEQGKLRWERSIKLGWGVQKTKPQWHDMIEAKGQDQEWPVPSLWLSKPFSAISTSQLLQFQEKKQAVTLHRRGGLVLSHTLWVTVGVISRSLMHLQSPLYGT